MKNFTQIVFSLVIVSLAFVACEQDEVFTDIEVLAEPTEQDLAAAYLSQTRSIILFAALELEHDGESLKGYIIDKYGELRSITSKTAMTAQMGKAGISESALQSLHEKSALVEKLSKLEVADAYRQAKRLSRKDVASEVEGSESSQIYLAFDQNMDIEYGGNCSTDDCSTDDVHTHTQLLISSNGYLEGKNSSMVTEELLSWLQSFETLDGGE